MQPWEDPGEHIEGLAETSARLGGWGGQQVDQTVDCGLVSWVLVCLMPTSAELVPDWGHTWGPLRTPHLCRHLDSLNILAGGFRRAGGEEAWSPVHGSPWEAEILRQSNSSDWGLIRG